MKTFGIATGMIFAFALMLLSSQAAQAATISTGAACSLVDAIDSANTNAAVGGCTAGAAGLDTIVVTQDVQLSVANNVSGVNNGSNGLPIIIEDLVITSTGLGVTRSTAAGTPEFRLLEIGTDAVLRNRPAQPRGRSVRRSGREHSAQSFAIPDPGAHRHERASR